MNTIYLQAKSLTSEAIERYTADAVKQLQCKAGFEQKGAVCQPIKAQKSVLSGLAQAGLAGAGIGLASEFALSGLRNSITKKLRKGQLDVDDYESIKKAADQYSLGKTASVIGATIAGRSLSGGGFGRRLAGAATGVVGQAVGSYIGRQITNLDPRKNRAEPKARAEQPDLVLPGQPEPKALPGQPEPKALPPVKRGRRPKNKKY